MNYVVYNDYISLKGLNNVKNTEQPTSKSYFAKECESLNIRHKITQVKHPWKHEGKGMKDCFQSPTSGFSPSVCQSAEATERSEKHKGKGIEVYFKSPTKHKPKLCKLACNN